MPRGSGLAALIFIWGCFSGSGCSSPEAHPPPPPLEDAGPIEGPPDAGLPEAPAYVDGGELGDGGRDCGACDVPCRVLSTGGGARQLGKDDAGIWSASVPCTRTHQGPVCRPTVFLNVDPDDSVRVIGRFPEDGGSGEPVAVVADEEALFFHPNTWQGARSVHRLSRGGGSPVEAFTTSGLVTLVGLDETNVYTLEHEPTDGGAPASMRLVAHERQAGTAMVLASLPVETGSPVEGAFQAGELVVWRQPRGSPSSVLERHLSDGGQPSSAQVFAHGVRDVAFAWPDPIVLAMTEQRGIANVVRVQRDGGTEVLLRGAPVSAQDTSEAAQIAVGGESIVVGHMNCAGSGQIMCALTGEVYRLSLTDRKQEDLCRGGITPVQVSTDGKVVYVETSTSLLELRPPAR